MTRKTAVVICPGRGTYNATELGYLSRHFPDAGLLSRFEALRAGQESLSDLDGAASFSLSRQARQQLEAQVQSQAVQSFRQRAQALARDFGFAGYSLRQVSVSSVERPEPVMQPRMLMAEAAAAPAGLALAAGKEDVRITVSGSIVLR